jgi:pimeloyl-ACP methyl ester carboxylesterase
MKNAILNLAAAITLAGLGGTALAAPIKSQADSVSDTALVKTLPGFRNAYAQVNSVRLHYVIGGKGDPIVLLPGWPQTWWSYHKVMPALAKNHTVIVVDLRGMGTSTKPADGYDKKTMAADIHALVEQLGYDRVDLIGHDIGSMVAFSYAANYPQATRRLVMMDVPHPDDNLMKWTLLPAAGTFGDKIDEAHPYPWWFAFHQVKGLPEEMLAGREEVEQRWFFRYLAKNDSALDARDRRVYAAAYASRDAIRAGDAWYQAFPQDALDDEKFTKLTLPILGLGGPGYGWLADTLNRHATNVKTIKLDDSGHFIAEEQPQEMLNDIDEFLKANPG